MIPNYIRMDFSAILSGTGLFYLIILTLLEIVLGIDNIIFISIVTDKLDKKIKNTPEGLDSHLL